jgi:hypothetical protein
MNSGPGHSILGSGRFWNTEGQGILGRTLRQAQPAACVYL